MNEITKLRERIRTVYKNLAVELEDVKGDLYDICIKIDKTLEVLENKDGN